MKHKINHNAIIALSKLTFAILCGYCTLASCQPSPLEHALSMAGDNRAEIEKVITHYQQNECDSLKLKAAIFLIENMPGHQSYGGTAIKQYYKEIDSILSQRNADWKERFQEASSKYAPLLTKEKDIRTITSNYLIANIDSAFHTWKRSTWARHLTFDEFCEYLLPYKAIEYQPMEDWRKVFFGKFDGALRIKKVETPKRYSANAACASVNLQLRKLGIRFRQFDLDTPLLYPSLLVKLPAADCQEYALIGVNVMRSQGIPVAMDFTPQWPMRSQGHAWNVVLSTNGKHTVFTGADSDPGMPHKLNEKMAKVFRYTYTANPDLKELNENETYIPLVFQNYFIKDVTTEYMKTCDVEIEALPELKKDYNYAYLAVFNNQEWLPVHWSKVESNKATFSNIGRGIVYLPVYYTQNGVEPMSHPFLLDFDGSIKTLKADVSRTRTPRLNRKYPPMDAAYYGAEALIGGKIQASNHEDFRDATTLHEITRWESCGKVTHIPDSAWQYWRYLSPSNSFGSISELMFYEKETKELRKGRIIGTEGSFGKHMENTKEKAFDNDPLTTFMSPKRDVSWVGMDFGEKIKMEKILYYPPTDGNMIQLGDIYYLYWWNKNGWQQLGDELTANDIELEYQKAPHNALFLLKDINRGKEERIFTYEDGEQKFW